MHAPVIDPLPNKRVCLLEAPIDGKRRVVGDGGCGSEATPIKAKTTIGAATMLFRIARAQGTAF